MGSRNFRLVCAGNTGMSRGRQVGQTVDPNEGQHLDSRKLDEKNGRSSINGYPRMSDNAHVTVGPEP